DIFANPTIQQLERKIQSSEQKQSLEIPKAPELPYYPLSAAQKRMYLLHRMAPESIAYNIPLILDIHEAINPEQIRGIFNRLMERHESFRTLFFLHEGEAVQQIVEHLEVPFQFEQISEEALEAKTQSFIRPFDLGQAPLLRVALYQIDDSHFRLICDHHHIVSDGVSMEILKREFWQLLSGVEIESTELQYKDFAYWQQQHIESKSWIKQEAFWLKNFEGEIPVLDLPHDFVRPPVQLFDGASIRFELPKTLSIEIQELARELDQSLFTLLFSAYQILLSKYSKQNQIITGTPIAGRHYPNIDQLVGLFVNTLPLKTNIDPEYSFIALSQQVKTYCLEAFDQQDYPFELLLEKLSLKRDLSRNPLFDTMFMYHPINRSEHDARLDTSLVANERTTVKFDLECNISETEETFVISLAYNTHLFRPESIERMGNHFEHLLREIVQKSNHPIHELELLDDEQKFMLLAEFNPKPVQRDFISVPDLILQQFQSKGKETALRYSEGSLSYEELLSRTAQMTHFLQQEYGVDSETSVAICLDRSPEAIISILAVLFTGAHYIPIDTSTPTERTHFMLKDSESKLLISNQKIDWEGTQVSPKDLDLTSYPIRLETLLPNPEQLAYMIYTSGSTGLPKGCELTHGNLEHYISWANHFYFSNSSPDFALFTSLAFDLTITSIFCTLSLGGCLHIFGQEEEIDRVLEKVFSSESTVNTIKLTPSHLSLLEFLRAENLNMQTIIVGGEALSLNQAKLLFDRVPEARLYNEYGPTETTVGCIVSEITPETRQIQIGKPIDNTRIYILNDHLQVQGVNIPGEIYISGNGVAKSYRNRDSLNQERFLPDPFTPGHRMYKSGDLAYWDTQGNITYLGRSDEQIKVRGYRIEPGEIETLICQKSGIQESYVALRKTEQGEFLCAYVIGSSENIREFLQDKLPEYMIPTHIMEVERLPLTVNGKVDIKALPLPQMSEREYLAPETDTEIIVAKIWSQILGIDRPGRNDHFFHLGGDSLKAAQASYRIEQELEKTVNLRMFFEAPVLSEFCLKLASSSELKEQLAIPKAPDLPYYPSSHAQQRIWVLSQLEEASKAYKLPYLFRIQGDLDVQQLEKAYSELIRRHESLRTVFITHDGLPKQQILEASKQQFKLLHTTNRGNLDEVALEKITRAQSEKGFDLEHGPLIEGVLHHFYDQHILELNLHHIISDGWSMKLLLRELIGLYHQDDAGLPELDIQYKDFAYWLQTEEGIGQWKKEEAYWLDQFSGEIPVLSFPTDFQRPAIQSFNGDFVHFEIDEIRTKKIRSYVENKQGSLFMFLLGAMNILLHKYSAQNHFVIGSPIAGRQLPELENQLGLYMNTLALKTALDSSRDFDHFFESCKGTVLEAMEHQLYPFDQLVEKLPIERDLSRSPLFDICIMLQNIELGDLESKGNADRHNIQISHLPANHEVSKFDFTFVFQESEQGIRFDIEYNTDLFKRSTMERIGHFYLDLTDLLLQASDTPLRELDLIPHSELDLLIHQFNQTETTLEEKSIVELFYDQVLKAPEQVALRYKEQAWTYQKLWDNIQRMSTRLGELELKTEELVGVYMDRSPEMLVALYAIQLSGGAYVPLDPKFPEDRISYILEDAGISKVICDPELKEKIADQQRTLISVSDAIASTSELPEPKWPSKEQLAYVIYTSGSTGKPKGVMIEHQQVSNFFLGMDERIPVENGKSSLINVTSISFDISVLELFWTLTRGISVCLDSAGLRPQQEEQMEELDLKPIDFSLFYFASGEEKGNKYKLLIEGAKFADQHGFSAIWTPERHFHDFGGIFPNPSVTGAAVATITENIQIRSGSCVLPLHNPIRVVEEWSVVDNLSNGRVGLSFATGWVKNDFNAFAPGTYDERHDMMDRGIELVQKLWRGDSIQLVEGGSQTSEVKVYPRPVQKELPIWVTAAGNPETFRKAGKMGASLLTHLLGQSVEELAEKIKIYREARKEAGFEGPGHVSLMIHAYIDDDLEAAKEVARGPFCDYLRSAVGLVRSYAQGLGQDIDADDFSEEDMDALLNHAFNRYYNTASLLGTPESCLPLMKKLSQANVDEVACLIDFGIDSELVLDKLQHLQQLKSEYEALRDNSQEVQSTSGLIHKHEITHLQCTPSLMKILLEEPDAKENLSSLTTVMLGGEALPNDLLQKIRKQLTASIHNMYGPTETTIWSATANLTEADQVIIGRPISNTQLFLLDESLNPVPIGAIGELYIAGQGLARAYLNRPELTDERFLPNRFGNGRMYRTGDLARWDETGNLHYEGRNDDQVKIRGHRIELGEIESALIQLAGIKEVAVIAEGQDNKQLVAYLVGDTELESETLIQALEKNLPEYMIPAQFKHLAQLPLTPNGKVDRKRLPGMAAKLLNNTTSFEAPRTEKELILARTWKELLNLEQIGIDDSFFRVGGDSIKAIQVVSKLNQFGYKLEVRDVFNHPTIRELALKMLSGGRRIDQSLVAGNYDLTPIQHWFFEHYPQGESHYNHTVMLRFKEDIVVEFIERAIRGIYEHHDLLRSQIKTNESGQVFGSILEDIEYKLEFVNYSESEQAEAQLQEKIAQTQAAFQLDEGPLFKVVLFKLPDGYRLLVVCHHLISDGISWRILFEDINLAYRQASEGRQIKLPLKSDSFVTWSEALKEYAKHDFLIRQREYWTRIVQSPSQKLKVDRELEKSLVKDQSSSRIFLDEQYTKNLIGPANEAFHTEVNDLLLTALGRAIKSWNNSSETSIILEGHGREDIHQDIDISRTIGWFTSMFPVSLSIPNKDTGAQLVAVKENLRRIPNKGIGFGVLNYLNKSLPKAIQSPEIIFNYLGQFDGDMKGEEGLFVLADESTGSAINPDAERPYKLEINGMVSGGKLEIWISFNTKEYQDESIQEFLEIYQRELKLLCDYCMGQEQSSYTLSDFTYGDMEMNELGIEELDDLFE
ncbi:MAG: amino acid adenylation domain-containing protein, partial [Bacteroidetes bacterium]